MKEFQSAKTEQGRADLAIQAKKDDIKKIRDNITHWKSQIHDNIQELSATKDEEIEITKVVTKTETYYEKVDVGGDWYCLWMNSNYEYEQRTRQVKEEQSEFRQVKVALHSEEKKKQIQADIDRLEAERAEKENNLNTTVQEMKTKQSVLDGLAQETAVKQQVIERLEYVLTTKKIDQ